MHFNRAEKHARRVRGSNSSEGLCEKFPGTSSKSLEKVVVGNGAPCPEYPRCCEFILICQILYSTFVMKRITAGQGTNWQIKNCL